MNNNLYLVVLLLITKFSFGQWDEVTSPVSNSLYSVDIHSSGTCFAGGIPLIKSTDFGQTWSEIQFSGPNQLYYEFLIHNTIKIIDANTIFIAGKQISPSRPVILKTTDGGSTWNHYIFNSDNLEIKSIDFFDNMNGIAVGTSLNYYYTNNGGISWNSVPTGSNYFRSVKYLNANEIIAVGYKSGGGVISKSFNGGLTWATDFYPSESFYSIEYDPLTNVCSVTSNYNSESKIFVSTNLGSSWVSELLEPEFPSSHEMITVDSLMYAGTAGIKLKVQSNFFEYNSPFIENIKALEFNSGIGLAVSQYTGKIYRYTQSNTNNLKPIVDFIIPYTCEEDFITVTSSNTMLDSYEWLIDGVTISNNQTLMHQLLPGEFGYTEFKLVYSYNGVSDTVIHTVYINQAPTVSDFTTNIDTTVCYDNISHFISVYNLNNSTGHKLFKNGIEIAPYPTSGTTVNYNIGTYSTSFNISILKWNINSCDSIAIEKHYNVIVDNFTDQNQFFYALDTILCVGDSSQIVIPNPDNNYEYNLFQNGLLVQTDTATSDTLFLWTSSINTNSNFTIQSVSPNGCSVQLLQNDSIHIDYVSADFNLSSNFILKDSIIDIDTSNIIGYNFNWSASNNPSVFIDSLAIKPQISYDSNGSYYLELEVETEFAGCTDSKFDTLQIFTLPTDSLDTEFCWVKEMDLPIILEKAMDLEGNIICVGYVRRPVSFGYSNCAVIQKYNSQGILLWEYEHPNLTQSIHKSTMFGSVATDNEGNIYITGANETTQFVLSDTTFYFGQFWGQDQHTYVLKLSPNGDFLWWNKKDGSTNGGFADVLIDNNKLYISINNASGVFEFQNNTSTFVGNGIRIVKMDLTGNYIEHYYAPCSYQSVASDVQPEYSHPNRKVTVGPEIFMGSDNVLYLSGETRGGIGFGSYPLTFSNSNCRVSYIAKLDVNNLSTNNWLGSQVTSTVNYGYGINSNDCTSRGAILSSSFDGNNNVFQSINWSIETEEYTANRKYFSMIYKYDSNLNLIWSKNFESDVYVNTFGGHITDIFSSNNNLYFVGNKYKEWATFNNSQPEYLLYNESVYNMFIGKINSAGNMTFISQIGQGNSEFAYEIGGNKCGDVFISGRSTYGYNSNLGDSTFNFELSGVNYGDITGSFMFKLTDSLCVTGGCYALCQDSTLFPVPIITFTDTSVITSIYPSYQWFFNGDTIPGATNQIYEYTQNGEYSVSVNDIAGCLGHNTLQVTCLNPSLLSTDTLVYFDDVMLSIGQYDTYQWIYNGNAINGAINQTYNYTQNGPYSVIVTDSNNCSQEFYLTQTCLNQDYITTPIISESNTTLTVMASYTEYQWYFDDVLIPNATNQFYLFNQYGEYKVSVIDENGCTAISSVIFIDGSGVSLKEIKEINLFPNPTSGELTLTVQNSTKEIELQLFDVHGKLCFKEKSTLDKSNSITIDISDLQKGVYYLKLNNQIKQEFIKVVKY